MKFYAIALFLFMLQISFAIVNSLGLFDSSVQKTPDISFFGEVDSANLQAAEFAQGPVSSTSVSFGFGDFVKGLYYFVKAMFRAVFLPGHTISLFINDDSHFLAYILSVPIYLIYIVGLAQFMSNRSVKSMS